MTKKSKPPKSAGEAQEWQDRFPYIQADTIFKVCRDHKQAFFSDYEKARTDIEGVCVVCYPPPNDSLGG